MADPFVDTDVIIRLLTGDDPKKQEAASALFAAIEAGKLSVAAPDTVIADAVYVLSSPRLYHLPRPEIQALLAALLRLPSFKIENRRALVEALEIYATTNLDFGDAMIVAAMRQADADTVYSYDADFDRIAGVTRRAPTLIS